MRYINSLLIKAIEKNKINEIDELVNKHKKDLNFDYAVLYAAEIGNLYLLQYLIKRCSVDFDKNELLKVATIYGNIDIVKYLILENKIEIRDEIELINAASAYGKVNILNFYFTIFKNIFSDSLNEALELSCENGHLEIVKILINKGVNIKNNNHNAIKKATENGYLDIVEILISKGEDVYIEDECLVKLSALNNHNHIIDYFVKDLKMKFSLPTITYLKSHNKSYIFNILNEE